MNIKMRASGIDRIIRRLDKAEKRLDEQVKQFAERLGSIGIQYMQVGFANAIYDGDNDVTIDNMVWMTDTTLRLTARGQSVAYIEFGTGTVYVGGANEHPKAEQFGAIRGSRGKQKGLNPPWVYFGNPGSRGIDNGNGFVLTFGNPANRVMYNSAKEMRLRIEEVAKEVFRI